MMSDVFVAGVADNAGDKRTYQYQNRGASFTASAPSGSSRFPRAVRPVEIYHEDIRNQR